MKLSYKEISREEMHHFRYYLNWKTPDTDMARISIDFSLYDWLKLWCGGSIKYSAYMNVRDLEKKKVIKKEYAHFVQLKGADAWLEVWDSAYTHTENNKDARFVALKSGDISVNEDDVLFWKSEVVSEIEEAHTTLKEYKVDYLIFKEKNKQ